MSRTMCQNDGCRRLSIMLNSDDVLHSFSIPVFRLSQASEQEARSGWMKPIVLYPQEDIDIQCAEMCGVFFGEDGGKRFVESPQEFKACMEQE